MSVITFFSLSLCVLTLNASNCNSLVASLRVCVLDWMLLIESPPCGHEQSCSWPGPMFVLGECVQQEQEHILLHRHGLGQRDPSSHVECLVE